MLNLVRIQIRQRQSEFSEKYRNFLHNLQNPRPEIFNETFQILTEYELLTNDLYRLRASSPRSDPLRQRTEDYVAGVSHEILGLQKVEEKKSGYREFIQNYRRVWRENFSLFVFTLVLFLASALLGWYITWSDPGNAMAFAPESIFEDVLNKHKWFEEVQEAPLVYGLLIARNNIGVAITCFIFGALLGVGGLYILSYNGLMLGSLFAFCSLNQFNDALLNFVVGHGALELTIIIASAFASFLIGRVFYMRPYRLFKVRMAAAVRDAKYVLLGILPWLIVAAFVEVFVSPWPQFGFTFRILVSVSLAGIFWFWTLKPMPSSDSHGNTK